MKELTLKAMAKVNLGLDVLRKREDGYHDLRMVMQSVYLYDKIRMTVKAEPGIVLRTNLRYLPTGADNLVCRAAQLLIDEFGIEAWRFDGSAEAHSRGSRVGRWQLGCGGSAGRHESVVSSGAFPGGTAAARRKAGGGYSILSAAWNGAGRGDR